MALLMLAVLIAAPQEAQVQTLAGESISGRITSLTDEALTVETGAGSRALVTKDVLGITLAPRASGNAPAAWVKLIDNSLLLATSFTVSGSDARIKLLGGGDLHVPTRLVDHVRFRDQAGAVADQWAEIAAAERSGDLIVIRKNDALDFLSGIVHDVADDLVQFEFDGETRGVKRLKVDGLFFHDQNRPQMAPSRSVVTDAAGSQWNVATLGLDGESLHARTSSGLNIVRPLADLARIDFSQGNVQYLGDLMPESTNWTPFFGDANASPATRAFFQPRVDRSLDGGPLQLGGKEYAKGIAAHSRTELVYRLPEKHRTFRRLVGIDDRLRPGGNVHLIILGDDRTLFEDTMTGTDAPRPLELDITGVNRLKLIVDFGDDTDVGDALDFGDARILK